MAERLSRHEQELLPEAVAFTRQLLEARGKLPTSEELRRQLRCALHSALRLKHYLLEERLVEVPAERLPEEQGALDQELREQNELTDDTWRIALPKTRIHTLVELVSFFEVDLAVWEVERFVVNKWEVAAKVGEGADAELQVEPLYQVKAFLRKRPAGDVGFYVKENARLKSLLEKQGRELRAERAMGRRLAEFHCGYDDLLAGVKEFVAGMGDLQLPRDRFTLRSPCVRPPVHTGHVEDAVLLFSDHHHGDVIRREDTSGFPEFDLVIGGNRLGYVVKKAKQILTLHRSMYRIQRLYVPILGDMGNGILHDSPNANALFMPAQVHFAYHMLKFAIEDLLVLTEPNEAGTQVIEEIVLLFSVGNHMRVDEKMPHKYQAQRTLDWLIYQFLIERFKGHPKITIRETMSPFIFEVIRGHRHLFSHGMQVGYKNDPGAQNKAIGRFIALARGLFDSPEWRRVNGLEGETFSRACIGDIHIPLRYPRFISNGSLNGQNELGVNWTLEPIPAGQWLWGVADKHAETWHYFLECTEVQRQPEHMTPYGEFAAEYARRIGRGGNNA